MKSYKIFHFTQNNTYTPYQITNHTFSLKQFREYLDSLKTTTTHQINYQINNNYKKNYIHFINN